MRPAEIQTMAMIRVDVDARRRGEVRVVGRRRGSTVPEPGQLQHEDVAPSTTMQMPQMIRSLGVSGPDRVFFTCWRTPPVLAAGRSVDQEDVAQDDRQADRHDHLRDQRQSALAERPPDAARSLQAKGRCRSPPAATAIRITARWNTPASLSRSASDARRSVTNSAWAKLTKPVTPKTSDRPTAATARIRPSRMPLAVVVRYSSKVRPCSRRPRRAGTPPAGRPG